MRTQTTETTLYTFDELSDDGAKDRARNWYRELSDFTEWTAGELISDLAESADMIGINMRTRTVKLMGGGTRQEPNVYWAVASQDAGASYEGSYSYSKGGTARLAADRPSGEGKGYEGNNEINRIARDLQELQRKHFYRLQASISHEGRHMGMRMDVERADGVPVDSADEETLVELLRDVASWIHRSLEREYEYQQSDAVVEENIRANEYEFTEDGDRA